MLVFFMELWVVFRMTKTELKKNITKINKLLRSDSYEAGIVLIKTLNSKEIVKGVSKTIVSKFKKYLKCKDWKMIEKAVELIKTLNEPYIFELLLDGCTDPFKRDKKNKIFSGINSVQPYLDTAFFGLLNHVPNDAKIHKSLRKENFDRFNFPPSDVDSGGVHGGNWHVEGWGYIHKFIWDFLLESRNFSFNIDEKVLNLLYEEQYDWFINKLKKINNNNLLESLLRASKIDSKTNKFIFAQYPGWGVLPNGKAGDTTIVYEDPTDENGGLCYILMLNIVALASKANIHKSIKSNNIKKLNWLDTWNPGYDKWDDYSTSAIKYGKLFSNVINSFPNLKSLKLLILGSHESTINIEYMKTLSRCENIKVLDLTNSVFITDFQSFSGHKQLEKLNLSNCRMLSGKKGAFRAKDKFSLEGIEKIPNLLSLNLSKNGRGGTGYKEGWNYDIYGNYSNGEDLKVLLKCKKLEHLIIMKDNGDCNSSMDESENIELNNNKDISDYINFVVSRDYLFEKSD